MPRTARASVGGICYHVINRGNARQVVFHKTGDFSAFLKLLRQASERLPMWLLAYCVLDNHFHLVLWPIHDRDLSRWMQWLMTAHVRRYHRHYRSSGHVWQGRFKAFPIQQDEHLLMVLRYVERNPVRANIVLSADQYPWSSLGRPPNDTLIPTIDAGPVKRGEDWLAYVNKPLTAAELNAVRHSLARETPFGSEGWQKQTAKRLGLDSSLRRRGRPSRSEKNG